MADLKLCSIEGCGKPAIKRGWCDPHYRRWRRHGDPLAGKALRGEAEKFLHEIVMNYDGDDCLIWPYGRYSNGYARAHINGEEVILHRYICEDMNGSPPSEKHQAAHSCGNGMRGCVTRKHLRWATRKENESDKIAHGTVPNGERNGVSVLTAQDVLSIRSMLEIDTHKEIANRFGVAPSTIGKIARRERWGHI